MTVDLANKLAEYGEPPAFRPDWIRFGDAGGDQGACLHDPNSWYSRARALLMNPSADPRYNAATVMGAAVGLYQPAMFGEAMAIAGELRGDASPAPGQAEPGIGAVRPSLDNRLEGHSPAERRGSATRGAAATRALPIHPARPGARGTGPRHGVGSVARTVGPSPGMAMRGFSLWLADTVDTLRAWR
jgi:hypothetical protein